MTRTRSPSERRAMFARMGKDYHAMNPDMARRAANTLPDTPENRKEWVKDSRRIDIEGIDTPTVVNDKKEEIEITRHFQKYSSDERASRMASTRLGHRQRESIGEYFYTNGVDNIAYDTKKEAIKGAERARP